jgi:hypothetical protein
MRKIQGTVLTIGTRKNNPELSGEESWWKLDDQANIISLLTFPVAFFFFRVCNRIVSCLFMLSISKKV